MKETDCTLYEINIPAIAVPRRLRRRRRVLMLAGLAAALTLTVLLLRNRLPQGLFSFFGGGSAVTESDTGGESTETASLASAEVEESREESVSDSTEGKGAESTEPGAGQEETESAPAVPTEPMRVDLSESERGDGYLCNLTDRGFDTAGLLEAGFAGGRYSYSEAPVVLLLHSYTDRTYADADPEGNPSDRAFKGVVGVGQRLAKELMEQGIPTLHCTVIHDGEGVSENETYRRVEETVKTLLDIYPSLCYVIDLRRLELTDESGVPPATTARTGAAQLQVTVSTGGALPQQTLALALCLRRELNRGDRRIAMPTAVTDAPSHADLALYCLRVDVGTAANTSTEAQKAAEAFAAALAGLLKK